jgi:hypothetical protein
VNLQNQLSQLILNNIQELKQQEFIFGGVFLDKSNTKISLCGTDNVDIKPFFSISQENVDFKEAEEIVKTLLNENGITLVNKNDFLKNAGLQ